jgi:WD40 repeat protein
VATTCGMSADGRRAVCGSSVDGTVKVWSLHSGHKPVALGAHAGPVLACSISADGGRVASGSEDRTMKLWDVESGTCMATAYGASPFYCIACQGESVIAGDALGNLWMLELHHPAVPGSAA